MGSESGARRGRPTQMDRQTILAAAAQIPSKEFSMRKLAEVLEVSSQSLYHYFPNKESIADAIAEELVKSVPVVSRDLGWRDYLGEALRGYRDWLRTTNFQVNRPAPTEGLGVFRVAGYPSRELLKRFDDFVFAFRRDGFELSEAVEIWILFQNLLRRSDIHQALNARMDGPWKGLLGDLSSFESGEFTELEDLRGLELVEMDNVYEALIEVFLEGISARYGVS